MMEFVEVKKIKYQIIQRPHESSFDYFVGVAKSCSDFFVLKNHEGFLFCRIVDDAELISDDGYLYTSC